MRAGRLLLITGLLAGSAALARQPAAAASLPSRAGDLPQEGQGAAGDTAGTPDTTVVDTAAATDTAAADTAAVLRSMPGAPGPDTTSFAFRRFSCGRACLLDHNALVLMDVLETEMPGLTMLRGSYFGGPHQFRSGAVGPGLTAVRLDGRPVPPLAGGQVDLARLPVGRLDRVTVTETPTGITVEGRPVRRNEPRAYSRISAGTGVPDVEAIRALYTNGLGDHFELTTGIDLLNAGGQGTGGDRFDFWGNVAWLPGMDGAGLELQWRNQSLERRGLDTATVDRREVHLLGRARLGGDLWIGVAAGNSGRSISGGDTGSAPDSAGVEVDAASVSARLGDGPPYLRAQVEARDGPGQPSARVELGGALAPADGLTLNGSVSGSRWEGFDGWSAEAGASYRPGLGVDLQVGVGGGLGVAGVGRPLAGRADSLTYRQAQARASARWGPLAGTVRAAYQDVSRQMPFGGTFDRSLEPGPGVRTGAVEGTLEAPLLPLDWLLGGEVEPVRLVGTWRHQEVLDGGGSEDDGGPSAGQDTSGVPAPAALYLPTDQARVAALFHDSFFQGDLRVRAELAARHRSSMVTVDPSAGGTGRVAGWTTLDWNLMLKIKDVRIWWRVDNTRGAPWEDAVGVVRPVRRNVFGVKWEFFN